MMLYNNAELFWILDNRQASFVGVAHKLAGAVFLNRLRNRGVL